MVVGTAIRAGIPVTTEYAMNRWSLMNGTLVTIHQLQINLIYCLDIEL
jgi:hypothetical protein